MLSLITFLTPDNQIYESTIKSSPTDISIPSNPYTEPSYFDRDKFKWVLDNNGIINEQKNVMNQNTKKTILNGFNYTINGIEYTFSYTLEDQQNMSDIVNTILINKSIGKDNYPIYYSGKKDGVSHQLTVTPNKFIEMYTYAVQNKLTILNNNNTKKHKLSV